MRINIEEISDDFLVSEREHPNLGNVVLVVPSKGKHLWELDEIHLRSLLCRPDGEVICSGFPKFMNYGERQDLDAVTTRGIIEGRAHFAEKMDGSLIIRTVVDGHVSFRTRGSHHLGDFEDPVMRLVTDNYPRLLDPDYFPSNDIRNSLLFEYTSPENKIVVDYDEPALTVLGSMFWRDGQTPRFKSEPSMVNYIGRVSGVNTPRFFQLPNNIDGLIQAVSGWSNLEGVVVWVREPDGSMHLAKIKAAEYIRIHALKYQMSGEKLRKVCHAAGISNEDDLRERLFEWGLDWESASVLLPEFHEYINNRENIRRETQAFLDRLDASGIASLPTRKRMVLALKSEADGDKSLFNIGINHLLGEPEKVQRAILARELGLSRNAVSHWEQSASELLEAVTARFNGDFDADADE
jgi:DNA-binding transcriptional regulator YiaG